MKSPVVKRSIIIAGHKTSVSLEDAFWKGLKEIATGRRLTLSEMVTGALWSMGPGLNSLISKWQSAPGLQD